MSTWIVMLASSGRSLRTSCFLTTAVQGDIVSSTGLSRSGGKLYRGTLWPKRGWGRTMAIVFSNALYDPRPRIWSAPVNAPLPGWSTSHSDHRSRGLLVWGVPVRIRRRPPKIRVACVIFLHALVWTLVLCFRASSATNPPGFHIIITGHNVRAAS